jgi:osomolarity two-component system, response regulator SKN7
MQTQIERMLRAQDEMTAHIRNLEVNYQNVLNEMVCFQRNMAQQDGLMQNLISYFLQLENGGLSASSPNNSSSDNASLPLPLSLNNQSNQSAIDAQMQMPMDDVVGQLGDVNPRAMNVLLSLASPPLTSSNPLVIA